MSIISDAVSTKVDLKARVEAVLDKQLLAIKSCPEQLYEAMRYAVFNGGKRLRPLLVYNTGLCFDVNLEVLDNAAVAVEFIHCSSLVHDDLPAMDDDDLRRGKPACHKAYNEATAILVGDGLWMLAYDALSQFDSTQQNSTHSHISMVNLLAHASGPLGIVGGQIIDMQSEGKTLSLTELQQMHFMKTGALIKASVQLGVITAGCKDDAIIKSFDQFGELLGVAFQIKNDLLDVIGDEKISGKPIGSDLKNNKATYPACIGIDSSKVELSRIYHQAINCLENISINTDRIRSFSNKMMGVPQQKENTLY